MSNNNLNVLAGKLEKIHISNQPTTYKTRGLPAGTEPVVRFAKKATLKVKRSPRVRGQTMKMTGRQKKTQERRREITKRQQQERKRAGIEKRRVTMAKRKAEREERAKTLKNYATMLKKEK